jgi:hypothetical protein
MALEGFAPGATFKDFEEKNGEDTFIRINLLYLAFAMNELNTEENNGDGEFDELCEDVLEIYLDDQFDEFNVLDVADGAMFIIADSNYTVKEYVRTYKRDRERVCEELLAYLQKARREAVAQSED